jgi:hypothetical protein
MTAGRGCSVAGCARRHKGRGLCELHLQRIKRTGTTDGPRRRTVDERFWPKVDRRGPDECWPWTGALNDHGYGVFNPDGRHSGPTVKAHRFVLGLTGPEFAAALIRHSCDNPPCVNPAHLSTGTHADNAADMVSRQRQARGSRSGMSKLTEDQVAEIRTRVAAGELQRVVAADYGVSRPTISRIVNRKGWLHVEAAPALLAA